MNMIKLTPEHQKVSHVKHPLFASAQNKPTDSVIEEWITQKVAGNNDAKDKLILAHLSLLRHTVGRYLASWPVTKRFLDEMVSSGVLVLVQVVDRLDTEITAIELGQKFLNNICAGIEDEVNRLLGVVGPSPRTNRRRLKAGKKPIMGQVECDISNNSEKESCCYMEEGFTVIEVMDTLKVLYDEFSVLGQLLDQKFWGLGDEEVAALTGLSRQTIHRYREELYKRYRQLAGEDE